MFKAIQDILYSKIFLKNYRFKVVCYFYLKKNPRNNLIIPSIYFYKYLMKNLALSKRSRALFGIGIIAISIGLISKNVINYPTGGCIKGTQEITFNI